MTYVTPVDTISAQGLSSLELLSSQPQGSKGEMAFRTTTILHPQFGRTTGGRILQPHERPNVKLSDYLTVPAIETYGVWSVQDILPKTKVAELAAYANHLETEGWR